MHRKRDRASADRRDWPRRRGPRDAIAAALLLLAPAGCAAVSEDPVTVETVDGWTAVARSPEMQLSILRGGEADALYCMAPEPDAVSTFAEGMRLSAGIAHTHESVGGTAAHGALGLGGRDAHVLLARELFYRACELVVNHRLGSDIALALYRETLAAVAPVFAARLRGGTGTMLAEARLAGLPDGDGAWTTDTGDDTEAEGEDAGGEDDEEDGDDEGTEFAG